MPTLQHNMLSQPDAVEVVRARATNIKSTWSARERVRRRQIAREMQQMLLRLLQLPCAQAG